MVVRLLAVLLVLASACSQAALKGNLVTCRGFLTSEEVTDITGLGSPKVGFHRLLGPTDMRALPLRTSCTVSFSSSGRPPSISISIRHYDSVEAAQSEFWYIRQGTRFQVRESLREGLLGEDSFGAETYQNMDGFLGFRSGADLVRMNTTRDISHPPATLEQLVQLAQIVRGRLPEVP